MKTRRRFLPLALIALILVLALAAFLPGCNAAPPPVPSTSATATPAAPAVSVQPAASPEPTVSTLAQDDPVKNVILLIGDGMGISQVTLGRFYNGNKPLAMDSIKQVGTVATYPVDSPKWITDSAAAGTAIACGVKTYTGAIAVDMDKKSVDTILELAKNSGRSTGLVSTMRITNATPAVFAAHDASRHDETDIAVDELQTQPDILLGGGQDVFLPPAKGGTRTDGRDLIGEARSAGYTYVTNSQELQSASGKILGLFSVGPMPYDIDTTEGTPSLTDMAQKAMDELSKNDKGFFLMVEGGRIDPACHAHDAATASREVYAFDQAVKAALSFAQKDGHTLVIVTADHETGGISLGSEVQGMVFNLGLLKDQKGSIESIVARDVDFKAASAPNFASIMNKDFGVDSITSQESQSLLAAYGKQKAGSAGVMAKAFATVFSAHLNAGWGTNEHTGTDVLIFSYGPASSGMMGHIDNTDIFKNMKSAMGL